MIYVDNIELDATKKVFGSSLEEAATKELVAFYKKMEKKQFPLVLKRVTGEAFDEAGNPNPPRTFSLSYSIPSAIGNFGIRRWVYSSEPPIDGVIKPKFEILSESFIINRDEIDKAFLLLEKTGYVGPRGHYKIIDEAADAEMFAEAQGDAAYMSTMLYTKDISPLFGENGVDRLRKIGLALGIPECDNASKYSAAQVRLKIFEYTQAHDASSDIRKNEQSKRIKEFRELLDEQSDFKLKYTIRMAEDKGIIRYDPVSHEWAKAGGEGTWKVFFTNSTLKADKKIESLTSMLSHNEEKRNDLFELIGMDVEPVEEEKLPTIEGITTFAAGKKWAKKFNVYQDGDTLASLKEKLIPFLE